LFRRRLLGDFLASSSARATDDCSIRDWYNVLSWVLLSTEQGTLKNVFAAQFSLFSRWL